MDQKSYNILKLLGLLFLILFLFAPTESQSIIPTRQDGFWYGGKPGSKESVLVEAFFDPVCPDSRDSWPPLKKILQQYGSRVTLVVHTFPLPYHDHAFATSRALHIVDKLNASATYDLLEAFFEQQVRVNFMLLGVNVLERFYGVFTFNMSKAAVTNQIVKFVAEKLGTSYLSAIKSGFIDSKTDHATRVSFKYGCLRGVYGTPYFFVNGFPLPDAGSPLNYEGWRKIIDPLVKTEDTSMKQTGHFL